MQTKNENLRINNEVVLIQDDKITPRNNWRKDKVEELIESKDCNILLKRAVQRLIPFEIMNCVEKDNENVLNLIADLQQ